MRWALGLSGALCATLVCGPSHAAIVTVTYSGTVSGVDTNGLFGAPGTNITGESFQSTYVWNTDAGLSRVVAGQFDYSEGCCFGAVPSPLVGDATLTINGQSIGLNGVKFDGYFDLGGQLDSFVESSLPRPFVFQGVSHPYLSAAYAQEMSNYVSGAPISWYLNHSFSVSTSSPTETAFDFIAYDQATKTVIADTDLNLFNDNVTAICVGSDCDVTPMSTVPEPAAWVIMIGGFSVLGGAVRRRRFAYGG